MFCVRGTLRLLQASKEAAVFAVAPKRRSPAAGSIQTWRRLFSVLSRSSSWSTPPLRPRPPSGGAMSTLSAGLHSAAGTADDAAALPAALRDVVDFAALPRTYASALHLCSLLPTNRDVTSLFDGAAGADLNAVALPEVVAWLARAGYADLERDLAPLRCVHVSGTKGKGSVCAFVTAVLVAEAEAEAEAAPGTVGRVGTYLSPHAVSPRERIWLDGRPLAPALFARYTFELWARLSAADPCPEGYNPYNTAANKPFYFRFLTLLALHVFLSEGVRSAVVECGIGGAYDATNVLPARVVTATAVTRLDIDHVAMLGRTLPAIAWHKAGIFKEGVAAFTVAEDEDEKDGTDDTAASLAVLRDQARARGARALHEIPARLVARWDGVPDATLPGPFQRYNMALAAAVAQEHLRVVSGGGGGDRADDGAAPDLDPAHMPARFRAALARATLRARCETAADRRAPGPGAASAEWLVDGAHTVDSLRAVASFFASREEASRSSPPPLRILLFGVVGRNLGALAQVVVATAASAAVPAAPFDHVLLVLPPPQDAAERAAAVGAVAAADPRAAVQVCDDVEAAVQAARTLAEQAGQPETTAAPPCRILVTGSFALAGKVLRQLGHDGEDE